VVPIEIPRWRRPLPEQTITSVYVGSESEELNIPAHITGVAWRRSAGMELKAGERVVVCTPDGREYGGRLVEVRDERGRRMAVVRLDSGWLTSYPLAMLRPGPPAAR
jgi:hypothetical protein